MPDDADDESSILSPSEPKFSEHKTTDDLSLEGIVNKRKEEENFRSSLRESKDEIPYSRSCAAPFSPAKAQSNNSVDMTSNAKFYHQPLVRSDENEDTKKDLKVITCSRSGWGIKVQPYTEEDYCTVSKHADLDVDSLPGKIPEFDPFDSLAPAISESDSLIGDVHPDDNLNTWVYMPCRDGVIIETNIVRTRHFGHTSYSVHHKDRIVMVGKKNRNNANYIISVNEDPNIESEAVSLIAQLRTISKSKFMLYSPVNDLEKLSATSKVNRELAVVIYSVVASRKKPRKITCILPKMNLKTNESVIQSPPTLGLLASYHMGETDQVIVLKNRLPRKDEKRDVWVLEFDGRVTKPSVKNFQLISTDGEDSVTLQFGRTGENMFAMDFGYPFAPLQAFGLCLTIFAC